MSNTTPKLQWQPAPHGRSEHVADVPNLGQYRIREAPSDAGPPVFIVYFGKRRLMTRATMDEAKERVEWLVANRKVSHTAAPWEIDRYHPNHVDIVGGGTRICAMIEGDGNEHEIDPTMHLRIDADARLIVEAPAMRALLGRMLARDPVGVAAVNRSIEMLEAAEILARIEGGAS